METRISRRIGRSHMKSCLNLAVVAATLLTASGAPRAQGVDQSTALLPPNGMYVTAADVHATYSGPGLLVVLSQLQHMPLAAGVVRSLAGNDETETFNSLVNGLVSINGGPGQPVNGTGPVSVTVFGKGANGVGSFNTEMLAMDLSLGGAMIRESPTLPSVGQTTITPTAGGYHIDSFFDVFTELSVDGGQTWIPSTGATHVGLAPVPEVPEAEAWAMMLAGLCLLGLVARARKHQAA